MRNQSPARASPGRWSAALAFIGLVLSGGRLAAAQQIPSSAEPAVTQEERDAAIEAVKRIVNQPVEALPRRADVRPATFSPGWFHAGAAKPDFASVDVRKTQVFPYDKWEYVTSDVTPGVVFRGSDLEFNAMTKYFYVDRSLPKKRLTEAEMLEVNRLYRIIGRHEAQLANQQAASVQRPPADALTTAPLRVVLAALLGLVIAASGTLYFLRRRLSMKE
jgi:hypothetical protein